MNANRREQIEQLYRSALKLDSLERERYLARVCGEDPELRAEVESLLERANPVAEFSPGFLLGGYRITGKLGAGGMGIVYRATDTKLGRAVALKLVRPEVLDGGSAARFDREARLLASLTHPHIGAIYGCEEQDGVRYLILEYVPGETLGDRIGRGRLPVRESLQIATQIAEALEGAHERGIIHRDLKPANIKITPEGQVKVLDFGLAKALQREGPVSGSAETQTVAAALTRQMTILGTPAYMSPEQACGKPVDTRTDIWAFGCVLYECLTGRQPFAGRSVTETLAAILEREPDWSALPATVPEQIAGLVRRCLTKDPRNRLRDIGDARLTIQEALAAAAGSQVKQRGLGWRRLRGAALLLAGAVAAGALALVTRLPKGQPAAGPMVAFSVTAPEGVFFNLSPGRPSPDGKRAALVMQDAAGQTAIWIRALGSPTTQKLAGTDGGTGPFWSPDGHYLGFKTGSKLMKLDPSGGPPQSICDIRTDMGASWSSTGDIVFSPVNRAPLYRVPAAGGTPEQITTLDQSRQENSHRWPYFLPDGRHFLFTARSSLKENTAIYVGSLDSRKRSGCLRHSRKRNTWRPDTSSSRARAWWWRSISIYALCR